MQIYPMEIMLVTWLHNIQICNVEKCQEKGKKSFVSIITFYKNRLS